MKMSIEQLKKKLHQACIGSGLSDDEMIDTLTETLVERINLSTITGDRRRWKPMAKSAIYKILDGVSIDTEAAKALCAELCFWKRNDPGASVAGGELPSF
jgi:hypothetical protein